ncbi:MAG: MarR family transcriptional regulator [Planctomycetota bacterium]
MRIEDRPAAPYQPRVLESIRRITRAVELHSRRLMAVYRITGPQLGCLHEIAAAGELSPGVLARAVHLSPSTVIGILDRLEERGLVTRRRSASDRRVVRVALTAEGESFVSRAPSPLHDTLAAAMDELPESELAGIAGALERMASLMDSRGVGDRS